MPRLRALLFPARLRDAGKKARAEHSRWLTLALLTPHKHPRIPTRKVDDGGFDRLMSDPRGRRAANQWWARSIQSSDQDPH